MSNDAIEVHPVQRSHSPHHHQAVVPKVVALHAYEVYCALYGEQVRMVTGGCRGGFGINELIGFLYARSFPKAEWRKRFEEALTGMEHV